MNCDDVIDDIPENEQSDEAEIPQKRARGKNIKYNLVKDFPLKNEFDIYWRENKFNEQFYHHSNCQNGIGEQEIFMCKFTKKVRFVSCKKQLKVCFPGEDQSVLLYESSNDHDHSRNGSTSGNFTWKNQPDAENIVTEGVKHNDYPSAIMLALRRNGIEPLPSALQLNNKIAHLRKKNEIHHFIDTSGDLREALNKYIEVPDMESEEGRNKPFVKDYKISVLEDGTASFWFHITTHKLIQHITSNPLGLFQIDPTYKVKNYYLNTIDNVYPNFTLYHYHHTIKFFSNKNVGT